MNEDTVTGTANDVAGRVKETAGSATGDRQLQASGIVDQLKGALQKTLGGLAGDNTPGVNPTIDKARQFAKDRPWATAAAAGVVGLAILNTLRGRGGRA